MEPYKEGDDRQAQNDQGKPRGGRKNRGGKFRKESQDDEKSKPELKEEYKQKGAEQH